MASQFPSDHGYRFPPEVYDAVAVVGMHATTGAAGSPLIRGPWAQAPEACESSELK